ncbi:putative mandelate racemase/muconate lactonizing enzyme [Meredithblackwellia eburnea MCA 4105]
MSKVEEILAWDPSKEKGLHDPSGKGDKIKLIETFIVRPRSWVFCRIETEKGIVGWGETMLDGHSDAVLGAFEDFKTRLIGWDPLQIEDIYQHLFRHRFHRGGPVLQSAIAGLDIALWDIKGKTFGVPVWQLLGGRVRDRVDVYGWVGGDSPKDVYEQAKVRKEQGFKALKMNATDGLGWIDSPAKLDAVVERVKQVKSLGLDVGLDFHGRVHKGMAKQLARKLEPVEPYFIEEPLLPFQVEEQALLYRQTSIPIATGERIFSRQELRAWLEAGTMDICQSDVAHCGGISELRKIGILCEVYDVTQIPHCPNGPVAFAATLQVGFATPNFTMSECSWQMHYAEEGYDLMTYLKDPSVFDIKDGSIGLLTAPGLGIEINEELVRKVHAENALTHWRVPVWRGPNGDQREW